MARVLICIGCNQYDYCNALDGAEVDAKRMFAALTKETIGSYDAAKSKLILSPTLAEAESAINETLFSSGSIDALTFYFAGHGAYGAASFYICLRDTKIDKLSATAFPLASLFLKIAEAAPPHTDIILDACFSGGLIADLGVLIKPELMGDAETPSVTLLAMSARDQQSLEDSDGGKATASLLDCVEGRMFVHDSTPWLDLTDIGKKVREKIGNKIQQTPVVWALNLNTQSAFCKNPHFEAKVDDTFQKWTPRSFIDAIDPLLKSHSDTPYELIADVERLVSGLITRAAHSSDAFRSAEIRATAVASLLEYCGSSERVEQYIFDVSQKVAEDVEYATRRVCQAIEADTFALLSSQNGGLADLLYLPIRITNILGWAGAAFHIKRLADRDATFDRKSFQRLINLLIEHYSTSLVFMSERQAPFVACALTAMQQLNLMDVGEIITGLLFNSAVACQGAVASSHIEAQKVLAYLLQRRNKQFDSNAALLARPTEFLTVILKSAGLFSLSNTFDQDMDAFDHVTINAYIPEEYRLYGQISISGGTNACFLIGTDIWTVAELEEIWSKLENAQPASHPIAMGAILSSMLFNDRIPWFLFQQA